MSKEKMKKGQASVKFKIEDGITTIKIKSNHGEDITPTDLMEEAASIILALADNYRKSLMFRGMDIDEAKAHEYAMFKTMMILYEQGVVPTIVGKEEEKENKEISEEGLMALLAVALADFFESSEKN